MIKANVHLSNDFDSRHVEVTITREDLIQLACDKARGMFLEGFYTHIQCDEDAFTLIDKI